MKVLTTEQVRGADAYTIAHEPVLSLDLMERAVKGLVRYIEKQSWSSRNFRIFAGYGNNGGDGIALARLLSEKGKFVSLHVVKPEKNWSDDARANLDRLPEEDCLEVFYLDEGSSLPETDPNDVFIDALFGSGLTREPAGLMARVIDHINSSGNYVVSIDMPSGLFGEDNRLNTRTHVVRANETLTFQFPKLCFFFPENQAFVGEWTVIPIGLHPDYIESVTTPWNYTSIADVAGWLKDREKFSHKGTYGHSLLVAGSTGKGGAAVLAASACIRSGSGLTTVMTPGSVNAIIQGAVPEAMTIPDSDPYCWTGVPDIHPFTAIGVGPGLGTDPLTWKAFQKLLILSEVPMVLDADALNLLSLNPGSLLQVPKNSILTPHPGEFKRLFGDDPDDYSRLVRMKNLAVQYNVILVLKGAHTAVAAPDGSVWFNTTGNPGMATGGSGDVLTGIITGLLAQGYDSAIAARLGVYLHGLAGDLAAEMTGQEALTAGDLIGCIGKAFLRIHNKLS